MGLFRTRSRADRLIYFHVWDGRSYVPLGVSEHAASKASVQQQALAAALSFLRQNGYAAVPEEFSLLAVDEENCHVASVASAEIRAAFLDQEINARDFSAMAEAPGIAA